MIALVLAIALGSLGVGPSVPTYWSHVDEAPAYVIAGGKGLARLASEGGAYMGILEGTAGLKVPEHVHENSIELIYVLEGGGWMQIDGRRERVRPGMVIQVPAGTKHSFEIPPDSKEGFKAVQVYTTSGPEQRFKKGKKLQGGH